MQKSTAFQRILTICLLLFSTSIQAQFNQVIEVGVIPGEIGTYHGSLFWQNNSSDTVEIRVVPNAKQLIALKKRFLVLPQQKVEIPFQINTKGLVGNFQSEFIITSNGLMLDQFLIKARILAPVMDVFKVYRNEFFPFRAESQLLNFKSGFIGDTLNAEIALYNFGGGAVDLRNVAYDQNYDIVFSTKLVQHNGFTLLKAQLRTDASFSLGFKRSLIKINDKAGRLIFTLPVQFTLEERPNFTEENSPRLAVNIVEHDFKSIQQNSIGSTQILITNIGTSVLELKKIESNCDCLTYQLSKDNLQAGESVQMDVFFNAKNRVGYERKTLAIFSNDPIRPTTVVVFKANVRQPNN
ncbi:MAG: hypothetical protein COW03_06870 [Cytophagales bacterium CG12_big_fil_rev_8_21_14_0_65_40_12]|nr:MAG: hypothetical protein COW03_06870 [Cytophagales bacterium CG12_big_fil_rev_8_21_14_0_65_40_12]PIW02837.1 MAG: hypothetical protein COW40_17790 [Cytophagales bacterium CG17_big_fil_post_rev_8_21_14_2_50_40_13]